MRAFQGVRHWGLLIVGGVLCYAVGSGWIRLGEPAAQWAQEPRELSMSERAVAVPLSSPAPLQVQVIDEHVTPVSTAAIVAVAAMSLGEVTPDNLDLHLHGTNSEFAITDGVYRVSADKIFVKGAVKVTSNGTTAADGDELAGLTGEISQDGKLVDSFNITGGLIDSKELENGGAGPHTIRLTLKSPKITKPLFKDLSYFVRTEGPSIVTPIDTSAFIPGADESLLGIQFHPADPVTAATAQVGTNYELHQIDADGKPIATNLVQSAGVVFGAAANKTTLTLKGLEPGRYQLRVHGAANGIKDIYGVGLAGESNKPNTDFTAVVTMPTDALPAPTITALKPDANGEFDKDERLGYLVGKEQLLVAGTVPKSDPPRFLPEEVSVQLYLDSSAVKVAPVAADFTWSATIDSGSPGPHAVSAELVQKRKDKTLVSKRTPSAIFHVRLLGPLVQNAVDVSNFLTDRAQNTITIQFEPADPITAASAGNHENYELVRLPSAGAAVGEDLVKTADQVKFLPEKNQVLLSMSGQEPGRYRLTLRGVAPATTGASAAATAASNAILDRYGHALAGANRANGTNYVEVLVKPVLEELPTVTTGLRGFTGPQIEYPEFTEPRKVPTGFNASDHVETRVANLYFFRDAHRVAQIINRTAQSYNRAAVDMRRQVADKARQAADQATDERKTLERRAERAAQEARQAEHDLEAAQQSLATAVGTAAGAAQESLQTQDQIDKLPSQISDETKLKNEQATLGNKKAQQDLVVKSAQGAAANLRQQVGELQQRVQALRAEENRASEDSEKAERVEDRAREEQFRREVAAAHEDPDTYAPGKIDSEDPVSQVSVSVVGEGVIHLRGPLKGVNIIRYMINQLDYPLGQVRVSMHTVQINGEEEKRMERVATRIQDYIDHSRFLTLQSAERLRRSVVVVASRKAEEAAMLCAGRSQAERDLRYLHAFFGQDFIDELRTLDSEFLKTGNKVLSLHSMDTTSLSSALFLLALAKNSVRIEILNEYRALLETDLPRAEELYFESGGPRDHHTKFVLMAENAHFESFFGFFSGEIAGDDTMTPLQREFIRLAQIFKSRLVIELELKQRIRERSLIEERIGGDIYVEEAQKALRDELVTKALVNELAEKRRAQQTPIVLALNSMNSLGVNPRLAAAATTVLTKSTDVVELAKQNQSIVSKFTPGANAISAPEVQQVVNQDLELKEAQAVVNEWYKRAASMPQFYRPEIIQGGATQSTQGSSNANAERSTALSDAIQSVEAVRKSAQGNENVTRATGVTRALAAIAFADFSEQQRATARPKITELMKLIGDPSASVLDCLQLWQEIRDLLRGTGEPSKELTSQIEAVDAGFKDLLRTDQELRNARQSALERRRPLDHKKFLDMLIDDMEDKHIELLEGTRAQIANIDNYIKRITTSLDDDFNTQFYFPAFREVRKASKLWDVTLGQVETTSILANNRAFGKVSPQATMEFDLPKRDILVQEAMKGAKAAVDDFGALLNDPSFLALTQLGSGLPTSSQFGASGGLGSVRNVLPGLDSATAEEVMSQQGPGGRELGAALEALIPDPAIYKFETGTGFEIRPVIQPDGQAVVFHLNYMYTTNVREPVRADEKHLGRVKRHFIDTDVQLSNYELREVSRYVVALKAARTAQGVPLLQDIPGVGILFRPLPSAESSLQENLIYAQATIFPTLYDLMGLRWAPAVVDLDPLRTSNDEFLVRGRNRHINNEVFDISSGKVDDFMQIPPGRRRPDLYRTQETIPNVHPNGYRGPGLNQEDSVMQEQSPLDAPPRPQVYPGEDREGPLYVPGQSSSGMVPRGLHSGAQGEAYYLEGETPAEAVPPGAPSQTQNPRKAPNGAPLHPRSTPPAGGRDETLPAPNTTPGTDGKRINEAPDRTSTWTPPRQKIDRNVRPTSYWENRVPARTELPPRRGTANPLRGARPDAGTMQRQAGFPSQATPPAATPVSSPQVPPVR